MANNIGTLVTSPIRPQGEQDQFPTAHANELLGGHHQVVLLTDRNAIPDSRRLEGMTCYVQEAGVTYQLQGGILNSNWTVYGGSGGSGGPNGAIKQHIHTQLEASDTWTMYHEFSGYPDVVLLDNEGSKIYTDLFYPDSNTVVAKFSAPVAGTAALAINQLSQEHFVQSEPAVLWTVNHDLGRYPEPIIFDTTDGNLRVYGDVQYHSLDTLTVLFTYPLTGELYLV